MRGKWEEVTIGALLARDGGSIKTGPFGTALKAKEYSATGVPLISVGEVGYGSLQVHEKTPRVPQAVVDRLPEYVLESGDIVFGRKGAVDRCALVKPYQAGWFLGSDGIRLRLPETVDPRFIAFQLQSPGTRAWLVQHATGTTMPSLNQAIIERIPLRIPPLHQQRAIAQVLGTLDDKIEVNRRMSETLEEMARALFKSWFVDFDPVRAKAEGRDPGLPKHLADLFPDSFEDSELGEIPKGWKAATLDRLAVLNPETWTKRTRPAEIRYVELSNTKWGRIEAVTLHGSVDAPSRARRGLRVGDTIVGTVRPGNGSYALVCEDGLTGSTGFAVLRPRAANLMGYVYLAATRRENIEALSHLADGGAYPAVRPDVVAATPCVVPSENIINAFSQMVDSFLRRIAVSEQGSRALAAIRDALLPKMISGETRVKDAEDLIREIA